MTILLAVALVFDLPAALQRAIPDYTASLQQQISTGTEIREQLNLGGIVNAQNAQLSNCSDGAAQLESCGTAPDLKGITGWLNTPGNKPIDLKSLRGKVVLIDFWAYSCINCQRAIPTSSVGIRPTKTVVWRSSACTPQYAFEKVPGNVAKGAANLGISYPIALDNNYATWTNYRNRYWPAEYLIDATGTVRHIKFGEGDYNVTETLVRQLLNDAKPGVKLPSPAAPPRPTLPRGPHLLPRRTSESARWSTTAAAAHMTKGRPCLTTRPVWQPTALHCAAGGRWTIRVPRPTATTPLSN